MKELNHILLILIGFVLVFTPFNILADSNKFFGGTDHSGIKNIQLPFIANEGQQSEDIKFYSNIFTGTVSITSEGEIVYALTTNGTAKSGYLKESIIGGSINEISGESGYGTKVNYFKGNRSHSWHCRIATHNSVSLGEVYPGIEVKLKAYSNNVEKLFYIKPGAQPEDIRVNLDGAHKLEINETDQLEVSVDAGIVVFTRPIAYQVENGIKVPVNVNYVVRGHEYGFEVGEYNREKILVIDPLLAATFLGGGSEEGHFYSDLKLALDPDGNVYVAGTTLSVDFPTTAKSFSQNFKGGADIFVGKFDPELTTLLAATYLGGDFDEEVRGLALDKNGNVYISGYTASPNFPTTDTAFDTSYNGGEPFPYGSGDVFISKLTSDLASLSGSTFLGGSNHDICCALVLDKNSNVFVSGSTASSDFPVSENAFDPTYSSGGQFGEDIFVAKLNSDLTTLFAATYLGGYSDDFCEALAYNGDDAIYIAGWAMSANFPVTPNAFQQKLNGGPYDAFVSKFDLNLTTLEASTLLGGRAWDFGYGMCVDEQGNVYITGHTASTDFPTTAGAFSPEYNSTAGPNEGDDVFVTKFDSQLSTVLASTYLGGEKWEIGYSLATLGNETVFVSGTTSSADFPTTASAFDTTYAGGNKYSGDVFISSFDINLTTLKASTYLGGASTEELGKIVPGSKGDLYVAGSTNSAEFPVAPNAFDISLNSCDAFIVRIDNMLSEATIRPNITAQPTRGHAPLAVQFTDLSFALDPISEWAWDFNNDGTIDSREPNPRWTYENPGEYSVRLAIFCDSTSRAMVFKNYIHVFNGESALEFHTPKGAALIPAAPCLDLTQELTLEAWIKPTGWGTFKNGGFGRIMEKGSFSLFLVGNRTGMNNYCVAFKSTHVAVSTTAYTPENSISLNEWQHIAATYGKDTVKIHINGQEQELTQTKPPTGDLKSSADKELVIGNTLNLLYGFQGVIDEVRIWNTVRNSEEILMSMNSYLNGREPGLVGYWPLNEGANDSLADHSLNHNPGKKNEVRWIQGMQLNRPVKINSNFLPYEIPATCKLGANFPNPFNPCTTISFQLPEKSDVELEVYDIQGRCVKSLLDKNEMVAGQHFIKWNGLDENGRQVSSGIYFYRIAVKRFAEMRKMILVK